MENLSIYREKIEKAKIKKAEAEGVLANIREIWKTKHGITSLFEVEEKIEELKKNKMEIEKKYNSLIEEMNQLIKDNDNALS